MNEIATQREFEVSIPAGDALAVFTTEGKIEPVLAGIRAKIDAWLPRRPAVDTAKGRDEIRAFAHRVTKSKTELEAVGKELAAEAKKIPGKIDATRRLINATLDEWRDEVRAPLTDWEKAEEARVERIKTDLRELQGTIDDLHERSAEWIRERLAEVKAEIITEERFREYTGAAAELKDKAIAVLEARLAQAETREAEAAELARLRREAEERAQRDREEAIRREAEEKAKRDAEAKAQAERDAAEQRERSLKEATERAEREAAEAQERAARAEEAARLKAAADLKAQQDREAAEAARREQDKRHRGAVNRKAMQAFMDGGVPEDVAKAVVMLIAARQIPAVTITY